MTPPIRAKAPIPPTAKRVVFEPYSSLAAGCSSAGAGVSWSKRVGSLIPTNPSIVSGHPQALATLSSTSWPRVLAIRTSSMQDALQPPSIS